MTLGLEVWDVIYNFNQKVVWAYDEKYNARGYISTSPVTHVTFYFAMEVFLFFYKAFDVGDGKTISRNLNI